MFVDDELLVARQGGFVKRLLGRGIPDSDDVVAALEREAIARDA